MILVAIAPSAQTVPPPPPGYVLDSPNQVQAESKHHLGAGPHTLIIVGGRENTRIDYKSGPACQRAKDAILAQVGSRRLPNGNLVYSTVTVCVPR